MTQVSAGTRLQSIDMLRGLVIVIMALDHVRDFFHDSAFLFNPLDVDKTTLAIYLTRWVTHFCAPTFVFLAGASAFLYGVKAGSTAALARFLFTRGLWLVFLEISVVTFAWNFDFSIGLQVIWAIGASMVVLSALVYLPRRAVFAAGLAIVVLHNLLDGIAPGAAGAFEPAWRLLHAGGPLAVGGRMVAFVVYPVLPWIGVMATGYGLGAIFLEDAVARRKFFTAAGLAMLAAFVVLRGLHLYGDPRDWTLHGDLLKTAGDFFDVRKYPPSLLYLLVTLGPVFLLLPSLERLQGAAARVLLVYGRVPMFFYVLHIYLAHGLMLAIGLAMGYPASMFVGVMGNPRALIASHWGFPLPIVYGVWLLVLALLYPACRWFGVVKQRRRDWWLSYL